MLAHKVMLCALIFGLVTQRGSSSSDYIRVYLFIFHSLMSRVINLLNVSYFLKGPAQLSLFPSVQRLLDWFHNETYFLMRSDTKRGTCVSKSVNVVHPVYEIG